MRLMKGGLSRVGVSLLLAIGLLGSLGTAPAPQVNAGQTAPKVARNIIIMISDGCGYNQIDATSMYQYGETGRQVYESFPIKVAMSTYSSDGKGYDPVQAWSTFGYVATGATDSAAAATAMSTGVKTYDKAIGVGTDKQPRKHILEYAEELGKATGVVSSVEFSHATPAAFVAHNPDRNDYSGLAQAMILTSTADLIMGTGHPLFSNDGQRVITPTYKYVGGQRTWDALVAGTAGGDADRDGVADPWTLVETRAGFQALMSGPTPKRVIGVPQVHTTLQQARSGDDKADPFAVPLIQSVPTLAEMTAGALNVLDNDPDGLFLMIEGGAIDWAGHANQSGRLIEEEMDFNATVEAVVKWIETHSNWTETLLIVTGDHETGYLTGPSSGTQAVPMWKPLVNNGKGRMPGMEWHSTEHTNSLIPVFAKGSAAQQFVRYADQVDPVRGRYIDNTEIADLLFTMIDGSFRSYAPLISK